MSKFSCHFSGIFAVTACLLAGGAAQALEASSSNGATLQPATASLDTLEAAKPTEVAAPALAPAKTSAPSVPLEAPATAPKVATSLETFQSLNNRYGCSSAKLDSNSSKEQINAAMGECLEAMEAKIATAPNSVSAEDLNQLKSLAVAFRSEAGALGDRVTKIEERIAQQPSNNFSTTTKLAGEAIIGINDVFGNGTGSTNTTLTNRVRLNLRTSFTGKDLLITRLQARNTGSFSAAGAANTPLVRLGYEGDEGNAEYIHLLQYQFPVGSNTKITANTVGNEPDTYLGKNFNPVLSPAGTGSISRFGRFNPIYRLSGEGAGATIDHKFSSQFGIAVGYGVPKNSFVEGVANDPANSAPPTNPASVGAGGGLFNGSNLFFSQLSYSPSENLDLGFLYARSYHSNGGGISGGTGSSFANSPFGATPTVANHFSLLASTKLSPNVVLSAWAGYTNANPDNGGAGGSADLFNGAATLAFNDVGGKGSTLGFVLGLPPSVTSSSIATRQDKDTPIHIESFYKYKVSDNLYITPGLVMILNPNVGGASTTGATSGANPTLFLGTIRTTFIF
jgi:Carbohydrate-selective porin, OprB family